MKLKSIVLTAIASMVAVSGFAQITVGEPTAAKIRLGNRAQAGDYGLYIGTTTNIVKDIFGSDVQVSALPLLNFKYMESNELEYRIGLKAYREHDKMKGEDSSENEFKNKTLHSEYFVYPGLAYHFNKSNILDVYMGAELPVGFTHDRRVNEYDKDETVVSRGMFSLGLGGFVGLQAYVGNLPLAVGVEYGISSLYHFGDKYKFESDDETYYSTSPNGYGTSYNELKVNQGKIGTEVRFTLTYYFKN